MKKNVQKKPLLLLGVIALAALVLAVSAGSVLAGASLKELVASKLAILLQGDLRDELLSGEESDVLGAGITGNQGMIRPDSETKLVTNFNELGLLPSTTTPLMVVRLGAEVGQIGVGSSTFASLQNRTGESIYLERCGIKLNGTTSSTSRFSMGTSSNAGGLEWDTVSEARNCLNRVEASSSTISYTATSQLFRGANSVASNGLGGTGNATSTLLEWRHGEFLVGFMTTGGSNVLQGSSVTSTAGRGFDLNSFWFIEYRMFSTATPR